MFRDVQYYLSWMRRQNTNSVTKGKKTTHTQMKEEQEWFRLKKVKTVQRLSICKMYTPRLRFCMCKLCLTCKPVRIPDMVWYLQLFNDFLRFWIICLRIDVIHHKLFPETLGRRKWGYGWVCASKRRATVSKMQTVAFEVLWNRGFTRALNCIATIHLRRTEGWLLKLTIF